MPHLTQRGQRLLQRLATVGDDASSAEHLGQRALTLIQEAVPFDEGGLFLLDSETLIFTRLLAYVGDYLDSYLDWVRDVYLVRDQQAGMMHFPTLLRSGGGVSATHERLDSWLRVPPPPLSAGAFAAAWRETLSPAGGVLRCGLAYRRRWIGALQVERAEEGPGFRPSHLELIERAAAALARALVTRIGDGCLEDDVVERPPGGHLVFDDERRLVGMSASGLDWLGRLPVDVPHHRLPGGPPVAPVAVQALVSHLAGSGISRAQLVTIDRSGGQVLIRGERVIQVVRSGPGDPRFGYSLTIEPGGLGMGSLGRSVTGAQWRVAVAVAEGLSDKEIAARLSISVATVHERVASLHALLRTRSRAQLVAALAAMPLR